MMKLKISLLAVVLLIVPIASATFTNEWGQWQDDYSSRGFVADDTANFQDGIGAIYSLSSDMNAQPLIADVDGDGTTDIVMVIGTYLQLYSPTLTLEDEINIGGTMTQQPALTDDWDGDGFYEIHIPNATNTLIYKYNTTNFNLIRSFTGAGQIGMQCGHHQEYCYRIDDTKIHKYNLTHNISKVISNMNNDHDGDQGIAVMAVEDMDRDMVDDIAVINDQNDNGNYGFILLDTNGTGKPFEKCNVDGLSNGARVGNPAIYNMDGTGDSELIFPYWYSTQYHIRYYRPNCALLTESYYDLGGTDQVSGSIAIVDKSGTSWACSNPQDTGNAMWIFCTQVNGSVTLLAPYYTTDYQSEGMPIVAADIDNDGTRDLITSHGAWDTDGNNLVNFTSVMRNYPAAADTNNDNELEVIMTGTNTYVFKSSFENMNPVLVGPLGRNYASPICVGTSVTFTGDECYEGIGNCHYTNDGSEDQERLVSGCGYNTTFYNGTYGGASVSFSCYFGSIGSYAFDVYIQDSTNTDNFTEYESFTYQVINGTAGITCNVPVSSDTLTGGNATTTTISDSYTSEEDIEEVIDTLTGQVPFVESFMVLVFTVMFVAMMIYYGATSPLLFAIGVFALWIVFAMIGWLSWFMVVLFGFVGMALGSLSFVFGGSHEG